MSRRDAFPLDSITIIAQSGQIRPRSTESCSSSSMNAVGTQLLKFPTAGRTRGIDGAGPPSLERRTGSSRGTTNPVSSVHPLNILRMEHPDGIPRADLHDIVRRPTAGRAIQTVRLSFPEITAALLGIHTGQDLSARSQAARHLGSRPPHGQPAAIPAALCRTPPWSSQRVIFSGC